MKYWVYINGEVPGRFEPTELKDVPGFTLHCLVCPADTATPGRLWRSAGEFPEIIDAFEGASSQGRSPIVEDAGAPAETDAPPSAAPAPAQEPRLPPGPPHAPSFSSEALDVLGRSLFRHVSELMGELAQRRAETEAARSLHRSLAEVQSELAMARERLSLLEDTAKRLPALEDSERALRQAHEKSLAEISERDKETKLLWKHLEDAQRAHRDAAEARDRLGSRLSRLETAAAEKDLALEKASALLKLLEAELSRLKPPEK